MFIKGRMDKYVPLIVFCSTLTHPDSLSFVIQATTAVSLWDFQNQVKMASLIYLKITSPQQPAWFKELC